MDDELVRIVATAAAGLVVRAVGTAGWRRIRERITDALGRGRATAPTAVTAELDSAAASMSAADPDDRPNRVREVEHELRGSFRSWLRAEPDLIDHLHAVVVEEQGACGGDRGVAQLMTVREGIGLMSGRDTNVGSIRTRDRG